MGILRILRQPAYVFSWLGLSVLAFDVFFILMKELPGERDFMCVPGANLTSFNITFAALFSLLVMLLFVGVIYFIRTRRTNKATLVSTSVVGSILGFFTLFCSFCVLPLAGVIGISSVLSFFSTNNELFKILSLGILIYGLWLLNKKMTIRCDC